MLGRFSVRGPPSAVLDLVLARGVGLAFDERIFAEYADDVLARVELAFPLEHIHAIRDLFWREGERVQPAALDVWLPDPADTMFLEVALSALASAVVTGNLCHFPAGQRRGVRVLTPREYVAAWAEGHG